ncbi:MAG: aminotransferase class III-fold pyridoxal phosphate-dependent enzyme, partial [Gaiellaceae bacterium]
MTAFVHADETAVFPRELDRPYPLIERAEGPWLYGGDGNAYLDAVGGGAMVSTVGAAVPELVEAARMQASRVSFLYNQQFTQAPQEELACRLVELAGEDFARVHFTSGGAEANETAVRLARSFHVERGDERRWRIVSPAQAYHGPTAVTLGLTGRTALTGHFSPYVVPQLHIPPATRRFDPSGEEALAALDALGNGCPAGAGPLDLLAGLVDTLPDAAGWHAGAHAFVSLAKLHRETATPRLARVAEHRSW